MMEKDRPLRSNLRLAAFPTSAERSRGAMLIVTMGVLTLLAVLGTTFVQLMRLERQATRNYIDAQIVDLINESALERAISDLRGAINHLSYTSYSRVPWLFKIQGEDDLANGRFGVEDPRVGSWDILSEEDQRVHRYKTKIIECAAQININGRQDPVARMLENLAEAIVKSSNLKKSTEYPLYTGPNQTGERLKGWQIVEFRNKLEGKRFRSKSQLRELVGQENYDTIKDFITIHAWEDPYTYKPTDGQNEVPDFQSGMTGGGGGRAIGGGGAAVSQPEVERLVPGLGPEPRSPVNINTAPEEVLIACLMGVGGRRPFPYAQISQPVQIDEGATIQGQRVPGTEEIDSVARPMAPRAIWVYMQPLQYDHALRIARRIIQQRKNTATQFMGWSSSQAGRPGFAEFVNDLTEDFFPNPTTAVVIDPRNPDDGRLKGDLLGPTEIGRLWRKGHNQRERTLRKQAGLPYHQANAFYYELCKAAVIANANPNTRISRFNPNLAAFTPVDKSDLVTLDQQDRRTPRHGYTTEFCFDSMGVFEVTTLGEIAQKKQGGQRLTSVLRSGSGGRGYEPLYRKKLRTVVKVYDVMRHTNQFHFGKTFQTGSLSSRNDRRYVVTWPEPLEAYTDVVSMGSREDGRIELAGFKDGLRMEMTPASRIQAYQSPETIIMAHGFQDRDDQSYNQLRRLMVTSPNSQEVNNRLADIFDANFSRATGSDFTKHYRRALLTTMLGGQTTLTFDPVLSASGLGSDLRPDGLHVSMFTMPHVGARLLRLPAHNILGKGNAGRIGTGTMVGAGLRKNQSGNVPYYNGGIAFWVKFEFDGDDPVFSGLIGCTQVVEDVARSVSDYHGSEGSQFYIFKNTRGELRIVRMYYHQAFPLVGGDSGGGDGGEGGFGQPIPALGDLLNQQGGAQQVQEYLDPQKPIARADLLVDVKHFKAHEWHHIAVDWNDNNPAQPLEVTIDFQKVQNAGPYIPQEEIAELPTAWVRLNERRPSDGLFVGGFVRHQGEEDAGLFKWQTNTFQASGGRGIRVDEFPVKRILANATIDELITYTGTFQSARRYYAPANNLGYFTNQTGVYTNVMEVPVPPDVEHVVMRSFDFTTYYPAFFYGDINSRSPEKLRVQDVSVLVGLGRTNPPRFREAWRRPNIVNPVAGHPLIRSQAKGLIGRNAEMTYQFQIPPATLSTGSMAGGSVGTPVVDDVTITYYLPDPKILFQEEAD